MDKWAYYLREVLYATGKGIKGFLIAQLKLSLLTFVLLCIGFVVIGIDWWGLKALGIAIVDMIPVLGSGIIMLPWAIIRALMGDGDVAWKTALLYAIILLVRQFAEPYLTGKQIGVRPLYTFLSTLVCILIFGPIGALLGAVVAIIIKAIFNVRDMHQIIEDSDYK
ncbi:AI-2E family transporter [Desemzia sp. RIT804]|uniref:AI-2E family transporter n=1 Tax=Desemzia sp. RIT 804 TaxID=2810209 RepID=UPI00194F9AD7|nr:AI-2E family transporter [Desemzia sp. RIT 804]MBM6615814.1 AI-2E family transporter [Desemzia sp. RIT 804]